MALLHYENLPVHRPGTLMRMSVSGLKIFYDFLTRTKQHMKRAGAVKRLAWSPGQPPDGSDEDDNASGSWVRLAEPADRPNEPESTFRAFLDENVRDVYEWKADDEPRGSPRRGHDRIDFKSENKIRILDRDPESQQLRVERFPVEGAQLLIRPNTWAIECQRRALQMLQNAPQPDYLPLLRLFEGMDHARWGPVFPQRIDEADWTVLTDIDRAGTDEQRRFVELALGTPDFAFLEGPPGSGKTTAICELILQTVMRGQRVLLCASTHVAVDNVLERLMDGPHRELVIPIRIGDRRNVSESARPWRIDEFVETERRRILHEMEVRESLTSSQEALRALLRQGNDAIQRMVLDAANLVCGTTIGILQHPDMRERSREGRAYPEFDVLIVDEASKTPFQEFLVPALWAKRWIVVGDPMQLSPYVDDEAMAVNIETCLPDSDVRDACIDAFAAAGRHPRVAAVATDSRAVKDAYTAQCDARGVEVADADRADGGELWAASVVVGRATAFSRRAGELPLDIATVRGEDGTATLLRRRSEAWLHLTGRDREEQPSWAREVGWRLARLYEQRFAPDAGEPGSGGRRTAASRLQEEIDSLLPVPAIVENGKRVRQDIDRVRRVALPSVLESLRHGFERNDRQRSGTALSDGLPEDVLARRHVLLSTQHRMHPEIAAFSHNHIYRGKALRTPEDMVRERRWSYRRYAHRAVWIDVRDPGAFRNNRNESEVRQVLEELRHFDEWAEINRRDGGSPWEVAVLTFYRGQERAIRDGLRRWSGSRSAMRRFHRGPRVRPHMTIDLCTVDRFQGHEADLVLISLGNRRSTSFLESPNRLNVALTRARYQRVVIGNLGAMRRAREGVLREFAEGERWEKPLEGLSGD